MVRKKQIIQGSISTMMQSMLSNFEITRILGEIREDCEDKTNKLTDNRIIRLLQNSDYEYHISFKKALILSCKLPNGFVIIGVGACVDPENFDISIGKEVALKQIYEKLWELEGYVLQSNLLL